MLKCQQSWHFNIYKQDKFHAQLSWERKKLYNLGARPHTRNESQEIKSEMFFPVSEMDHHSCCWIFVFYLYYQFIYIYKIWVRIATSQILLICSRNKFLTALKGYNSPSVLSEIICFCSTYLELGIFTAWKALEWDSAVRSSDNFSFLRY